MKHGLAMFFLIGGCSSQSMPMMDLAQAPLDLASTCPNDLPSACPSPPPSWMATIQTIINDRCESCHVPGGQGQPVLLTTLAQVQARASSVLTQVYSCYMPPPDGGALTASERAALLAWLVCGAPDN
jgi:uncharacterized membrane protein